jgi:hypothetical protein
MTACCALGPQCRAHLPDDLLDEPDIESARRGGRRADADDAHLSAANGLRTVHGGSEQASLSRGLEQIIQARLDDRGDAVVERIHFLRVHVDANDAVPILCQQAGRHRAHVSEAKDADIHEIRGTPLSTDRGYWLCASRAETG